jgi:hypothetical protein
MAILPVNVDYTTKDFNALRLRLQGLIRSVYPNWTEFNVANFGNIMLESFCFVGDVMSWNQDKQMREVFWPTVVQYVNAIRLGRMINFSLTSAGSSTGTARFSLPSLPASAVLIPYNTRIRTADINPIYYRTTEIGKEIPTTGNPWVDVAIEQAIAVGYRDPTTSLLVGGETFVSTGGPNQRYITTQGPVIDGTIDVEAEDGVYQEIQSFLDNDPSTGQAINANSRVFFTLNDAEGTAIIVFGNGKTGKIPEGNITVVYKTGGGVRGNVEADQITVIDSTNSDIAGVSVTNPSALSGGTDHMSVLQARARGPQSLRVRERCVTKEDFEITALTVPGVARALMLTSNEDATIQENAGTLLIVAQGEQLESGRIAPATPSATMLADVLEAVTVDNPPTLTFSVSTEAAPFRAVNVSARVYLESGVNSATVGQAIRDSLDDFFAAQLNTGLANPDIDFGANVTQADGTIISEIAWSSIFNAILDTDGVRRVDEGPQGLLLNSLRQSVSLLVREFPQIGTVTLYDVDAAAAI